MDAAQFSDPHTVELGGTRRVSARYVTIATGARAAVPPVIGLDKVRYHTNETLFELTRQPRQMAILGAGPVGLEMAQAFGRLGSKVGVLEVASSAMVRGDPELVGLLQNALTREGVDLRVGARTTRIEERDGRIALNFEQTGQTHELTADALLVATGRKPSVQGLNLDAARVRHDSRGIEVDSRCRTSVRHIYAVGDVTGRYALTHMSEHMAKVAMANALLKVPLRIDTERVPWAVFTDPELAQVGASERELREQGRPFETYRFPYSKLDRAVTDGAYPGIIKILANRRTGRVLGATILGKAAGDLICSLALAMRRNIKLREIADTVHPYPTYGLGVRRAADQWYIQRITPRMVRILQRIFGYRGPIIERAPGTIL